MDISGDPYQPAGGYIPKQDVIPDLRFTTLNHGERMRWADRTMTVIPSDQVLKLLRAIRDRECSVENAIDVITDTMR